MHTVDPTLGSSSVDWPAVAGNLVSRYIDNNNISLLLLFTNPVIASRAQVTLACDSITHYLDIYVCISMKNYSIVMQVVGDLYIYHTYTL